jgi:hypothetical protein
MVRAVSAWVISKKSENSGDSAGRQRHVAGIVILAGVHRTLAAATRTDGLRIRTSCRAVGRIRGDRRSVDFISALVPDAYAAAAIAQFDPRNEKMPRQFVSGGSRVGATLEQHSSRVQNNVAIEEEIEEEARHFGDTISKGQTRNRIGGNRLHRRLRSDGEKNITRNGNDLAFLVPLRETMTYSYLCATRPASSERRRR